MSQLDRIEESIREIRDHTQILSEKVSRIDARAECHSENGIIHQVPPCSAQKALATKIWAVFMVALAALIASATSWMEK